VLFAKLAEPAIKLTDLGLGPALESGQGEQLPCVLVAPDVAVVLDAAVIGQVNRPDRVRHPRPRV
jgi:hypothetical protein